MPLLVVQTNTRLDDTQALAKELSAFTSKMLAKPESYVMLHIQDAQTMTFAGEDSPCALIQLESLSLPQDQTTEFSANLCEFLSAETAIPASRIYIKFSSPDRHMWGWDSRTFG